MCDGWAAAAFITRHDWMQRGASRGAARSRKARATQAIPPPQGRLRGTRQRAAHALFDLAFGMFPPDPPCAAPSPPPPPPSPLSICRRSLLDGSLFIGGGCLFQGTQSIVSRIFSISDI